MMICYRNCILLALVFSKTLLYAQAPIITDFTPSKAKTGDTILLNGSNFSGNANGNIVYFGAVKAAVITANTSSLMVKVPAGAKFAPIRVLNMNTQLQGRSKLPFHHTFAPSSPFLTVEDFEPIVQKPMATNGPGFSGLGATRIADLDGDGRSDIIVQDNHNIANGALLRIFRNLTIPGSIHQASFNNVLNLQTIDQGSVGISSGIFNGLIVADVNNDGKLDLVVAGGVSTNQNNNQIFINTSTPSTISFAPGISYNNISNNNSSLVAIEDVDGDGRLDFICYPFSILKNTTVGGSFSLAMAPAISIPASFNGTTTNKMVEMMDMDGDGKSDLVALGSLTWGSTQRGVHILKNTSTPGNFAFGSASYIPMNYESAMVSMKLGDLDGDGRPDIAATDIHAENNKRVYIARNTSQGTQISFAQGAYLPDFDTLAQKSTDQFELKDMNGDGRLDIVVNQNGYAGGLLLYQNAATQGQLGTTSFYFPAKLPSLLSKNIDAGDLDNDGLPDLASIRNDPYIGDNNYLYIYRNRPLPVITPAPPISCPDSFAAKTVTYAGAEGATMAYQWQLRSVGTNTFSNLSDGAVYNGTNTPTLSILQTTPAMHGDVFRCRVTANGYNLNSRNDTLFLHQVVSPVITNNNPVLSTGIYDSYTWFLNGQEITGANAQQYTIVDTGSYMVKVTDSNGCGVFSEPLRISNKGTGLLHTNDKTPRLSIFPNPATSVLHLNYSGDANVLNYTITNALGEVVMKGEVSTSDSDIKIAKLVAGLYFLQVCEQGNCVSIKFLKQ